MLLWINFMLACTLLVQLPCRSSGFSAWLPCQRYLEEDEVIMNSKVVGASDSDATVKLAVYDSSGSRVDEDSIVWVDDASTSSLNFQIRMDASTTHDLSDIQFVAESYPFEDAQSTPNAPSPPNVGAPSPNVQSATSTQKPHANNLSTKFTGASTGGGVQCNGRRSHTRGKTGFVKYELVPKPSSNDGSGAEGGILSEIWAGWSENHGKVTLTPKIYFKRRIHESTNNEEL
jgi:hypothetical protein